MRPWIAITSLHYLVSFDILGRFGRVQVLTISVFVSGVQGTSRKKKNVFFHSRKFDDAELVSDRKAHFLRCDRKGTYVRILHWTRGIRTSIRKSYEYHSYSTKYFKFIFVIQICDSLDFPPKCDIFSFVFTIERCQLNVRKDIWVEAP